jgi:hypothetical protein
VGWSGRWRGPIRPAERRRKSGQDRREEEERVRKTEIWEIEGGGKERERRKKGWRKAI